MRWLFLTLKDFRGCYIRATVLLFLPLKHTCALLFSPRFSFNADGQMGLASERTGPADIKGGLMSHAAGWTLGSESFRAECSVSTGKTLGLRQYFALCSSGLSALSPFLTLLPKFSSPCYLTLAYRETFSLSSDAWTRTGLKPSWGKKLEFALCSLQRWVPLTSLFLPLGFECHPWDAVKVDSRQFGAPLCNESDHRCCRWIPLIPGHCGDNTFLFFHSDPRYICKCHSTRAWRLCGVPAVSAAGH